MAGLRGFQKPKRKSVTREVRLPVLSRDGIFLICSCGWAYGAERDKVREDAGQRHLDRKHGGNGLWM